MKDTFGVRAIAAAAALAIMAGTASAQKCRINKEMLTFTPMSNIGQYVIAGTPGSVTGAHPIRLIALDRDTAEKAEAAVNPDGSFSVTVDATQGDKIKLTAFDSAGGKKSASVRIPIMQQRSLLDGEQKTVDRRGETPGGPAAPAVAAGLPEGAPPPGPRNLRKIVAVAKFDNKANVASRFDLGTGMQAQLINALKRSDRFVVREQELLRDVFGEQDLAQSGRMAESRTAEIGKALTAQYLVRGTVTEFDEAEFSDSKGFSMYGVGVKGGKSRAHMAVVIDLIDTTSGTVIASQRMEGKAEGRGAGGGLSVPHVSGGRIEHGKQKHTPVNKAMQVCIDNTVYFIMQELDRQPWSSAIVKADGEGPIVIRGGTEDGMEPGYRFGVYRRGEDLRDPTTGELLDVERKKLGAIEVTQVREKIAFATPVVGSGFQAGDLVMPE
ncbi:MAG: CsgG/HfaB family protein [bacterium]|nr:CsgG/HfaB family protein [bacterium]